MKKIFTILSMLMLFVSGAWAQTVVTINDQTDLSGITNTATSEATATHKYGVYSGSATAPYTTFTTNVASGVPGLTISTTANILKPTYVSSSYSDYQHVMAVYTAKDDANVYTFTITAPSGYTIKNYNFTALSTSDGGPWIITPNGGDAYEAKGINYKQNITATVNASTATFTIKRNSTNNNSTLCIPRFTVTLEKIYPFTYTVSPTTGTFYTNASTATTSGFANKWLSADSQAQLTVLTNSPYTGTNNSGNNMVVNQDATPFRIHSDTYHLSVPFGYVITGWNIEAFTNYTGGTSTIKGVTISQDSNNPTTVSTTGLISRTASFAVSTASPWITVNSMNVTIKEETSITNLANLSNAKTYIIYGVRGCWNTASDDATQLSFVGTDNLANDTKLQIALVPGTSGRYYAYSVTAGKFLNGSSTSGSPISLSDTPEPIFMFSTGNNDYPWFFSFTGDKSAQNINISSNALKVMDYNTFDDGNRWRIAEANTSYTLPSAVSTAITNYETANANVTYKLNFNGNTIASVAREESIGTSVSAAATIFGTAPAYCSYGTPDVATIAASTTEVNVNLNWSGPFTISSSFESATWYYMKLHNKYSYYDTSTTPYPLISDKTDTNIQYSPNAMWAFLGNPYNGIIVMNKRAGNAKYLDSYNDNPQMGTTLDGYTKWTITRQNDTNFSLKVGNKCLNDHSGNSYLKYWTDASAPTDGGSTLVVESVPYKDLTIADITLYADSHNKGQYFGVDETSYNTLITEYKAYESISESDYNTIVTNIGSLLTPKFPESGFYRIKSSGKRGGQSYITYGKLNDEKGVGIITTGNDQLFDLGTIVYLKRIGAGKNYNISIQGLNVQQHSGDNTLFRVTEADAATFAFNHINLSGMVNIYDGTTHGYLHEANWYNSSAKINGVVGWNAGDGSDASSWSIEDATSAKITLNSDGASTPTYYATVCVPFSFTTDENTTAYTLAKSGNYLIPTEVATVPAGTPVLLKGSAATAILTLVNSYAASPLATTALTGTYTDLTTIDGESDYFLGKYTEGGETSIGFYHWDGTTLKANRAYLPAQSNGANGFSIVWDETTGISGLTPALSEGEGAVYDLQGRRLGQWSAVNGQLPRGIYVVNGKKVVVK